MPKKIQQLDVPQNTRKTTVKDLLLPCIAVTWNFIDGFSFLLSNIYVIYLP